ncbi:hypothetical protein GCM10023165_10300 [Variovorax defluvii]|uniref:Integrase catalytic domain-containing protein n=1 Tax=Variovorax defluvii TaxID=913761 RepID=A0ABP8H5N3_9BURK
MYAATLAHYGVVADPARVRDPNRKGAVENAIRHTQATALKGRRFESLDAQNEFLEHWERKWAAPRIHGSTRRQVQAMFDEERPLLQPLPMLGMQYFTESQRTVCDDTCVRIDHSSYAARPAPIARGCWCGCSSTASRSGTSRPRRCCARTPESSTRARSCCPWPSACSIPRARHAASSARPG